MRISADTNVLLRTMVRDDAAQAQVADELFDQATMIAISLSALCEFAWVLDRVYRFSKNEIGLAIRAILKIGNVTVNMAAAQAGLDTLTAGGDFPDGVIAYEGRWLGGETFVSFDRKAVSVLSAQGFATRLLR